jgi:hypothetical protein
MLISVPLKKVAKIKRVMEKRSFPLFCCFSKLLAYSISCERFATFLKDLKLDQILIFLYPSLLINKL